MEEYKIPQENIKKIEFTDEGVYVTASIPSDLESAMKNRYPIFQEVSIDELDAVHDIRLGEGSGEPPEAG